jgi:hypothetical protein
VESEPFRFGVLSMDAAVNQRAEKVLYPTFKEYPVRLVNNPNFIHPQNVGLAHEQLILDLIYSCNVYIEISKDFTLDAILMSKPILKLEDYEISLEQRFGNMRTLSGVLKKYA